MRAAISGFSRQRGRSADAGQRGGVGRDGGRPSLLPLPLCAGSLGSGALAGVPTERVLDRQADMVPC